MTRSVLPVVEVIESVGPITELLLRRAGIIVRRGDRRDNRRTVRAACQVELSGNQLMNHRELILRERDTTCVVTLGDSCSMNGVDLRSGQMVRCNDQLAASI